MALRTDMLIKTTTGELVHLRAANALLALQLETARREHERVLLAIAQAVYPDEQTTQALVTDGADAVIEAVQWLSCLVENSGALEGPNLLADARRWSCAWKQAAKVWRDEALSLSAEIEARNEMECEEAAITLPGEIRS